MSKFDKKTFRGITLRCYLPQLAIHQWKIAEGET